MSAMSEAEAKVETWHELFARYEAAKEASLRFYAESYDPFARVQKIMFPEWPKPRTPEMAQMKAWEQSSGYAEIIERYEETVETYSNLEGELVRRPAPDAKAALWKFKHLYLDDEVGGSGWETEYVRQAHKDIARFLERVA